MKFLNLFRHWEDVEEYRARSVIYSERDPADVLYFVLSGEVELSLQGKTLNIEKESGIIGEMAMFSSATRNATATALTKVKLARLDREQFRQLIGKNPEFSLHAMAVLANRLRAVDNYITNHIDHNS
jgi:CRP-like cAMP-binding protein